jgi:hypothetical protein
MKFKMTLAVAALLMAGLSSAAAYADTLTFTLTNPNGGILADAGGTLTFDATVTAASTNSGAIFLGGDSFNVTAPVTLDDSDFFNNFPLSLAPGTSFTGELFTLTLPPGMAVGSDFLGTFTLFGGAAGANDPLGTVNFSVSAATPEPSSIVLLLTGMAGTLLWAGSKGKLNGWVR